jgi:hypothetical protein
MKSLWMVLMLMVWGGLLPACAGIAPRSADIGPLTGLWAAPPHTATPVPSPTLTSSPVIPTPAPAIMARVTAPVSPLPTPTATATSAPSPTPTPVNWLAYVGRTPDNLIFMGNPNAPVTMIDYSDFL